MQFIKFIKKYMAGEGAAETCFVKPAVKDKQYLCNGIVKTSSWEKRI